MIFDSKGEIAAWIVAIIGVAIMGVLAFHGPFHDINKVHASSFAPQHVKIVTDPRTVGRYVPSTVRVHVGQAIIFTNESNADHTVTESSDAFDSGNIATGGATYTYIASATGTFHYVCSYHPFMHGTIVVVK